MANQCYVIAPDDNRTVRSTTEDEEREDKDESYDGSYTFLARFSRSGKVEPGCLTIADHGAAPSDQLGARYPRHACRYTGGKGEEGDTGGEEEHDESIGEAVKGEES